MEWVNNDGKGFLDRLYVIFNTKLTSRDNGLTYGSENRSHSG